jgi:hypothetical protein
MDLVLSGRKTQTTRLAHEDDRLKTEFGPGTRPWMVARANGRGYIRFRVGGIYGIQRKRNTASEGHFCCTYIREVDNPMLIDLAFAQAEGFDTVEEFTKIWRELHGKNAEQRAWAIGMELIK